MKQPDGREGHVKRWMVLLVQDGGEIKTEDPNVECFLSEKEAIKYAKECSRQDKDGGEGAVYHIMKTTHTVHAKRHVTVKVMATK